MILSWFESALIHAVFSKKACMLVFLFRNRRGFCSHFSSLLFFRIFFLPILEIISRGVFQVD